MTMTMIRCLGFLCMANGLQDGAELVQKEFKGGARDAMIINAAGTLRMEDHALEGKLANDVGLIRKQSRAGAGDAPMEEAAATSDELLQSRKWGAGGGGKEDKGLRQEQGNLSARKNSELLAIARNFEVEQNELDLAADAEDMKGAVVELILEKVGMDGEEASEGRRRRRRRRRKSSSDSGASAQCEAECESHKHNCDKGECGQFDPNEAALLRSWCLQNCEYYERKCKEGC